MLLLLVYNFDIVALTETVMTIYVLLNLLLMGMP